MKKLITLLSIAAMSATMAMAQDAPITPVFDQKLETALISSALESIAGFKPGDYTLEYVYPGSAGSFYYDVYIATFKDGTKADVTVAVGATPHVEPEASPSPSQDGR